MDINDVVQVVGNVGFPIAITIYLLKHFGAKIESLDSSIQDLSKVIASIEHRKD